MGYLYNPDDGKIHTRYSELKCYRSLESALKYYKSRKPGLGGQHFRFGQIRHDQWEAESKKSGRTPACFRRAKPKPLDMGVDLIEHEIATEIFPGVILHSRIDAGSTRAKTIIDYKTSEQFHKMQFYVYAMQLGIHDIHINKGICAMEVWKDKSSDKDWEVDCWKIKRFPISLYHQVQARLWVKQGVENLLTAAKIVDKR